MELVKLEVERGSWSSWKRRDVTSEVRGVFICGVES